MPYSDCVLPVHEQDVEKMTSKGWLGDDGICRFRDEDIDCAAGYRIVDGVILFVDGDGKAFTKEKYLAAHPNAPDPEVVLRLKGRLGPKAGGFQKIVKIGRYST